MMINLANSFAEMDCSVELVVVRKDGPYLPLVGNKVTLVCLESRKVVLSLIPLIRYLKKTKPDALLVTLRPVSILALVAKIFTSSHTKFVIREACQIVYKPDLSRGDKIAYYLLPVLYPLADKIIAVSDGVKENVQTLLKINPDKVRSVLNPTITRDFFDKLHEPLNHPWFDSKCKVVISYGRLIARKRFADLIEAFARVPGEDLKLLIMGNGPLRGDLENLIANLQQQGRIEICDFEINPYKFLSKSELFVLSSEYEGNPNSLIEALASGIKVISTNCPSGPSEVLDGGKYGLLVNVGDVKALALAIKQQLGATHNKSAQIKFASRYYADKVSQDYLNEMLS